MALPSGHPAPIPGDGSPPAATHIPVSDDGPDLAAARAGDFEAFARLYDRHSPLVLSLCRRHALADAEDAAQETFIRAHRMLASLHHPDRLAAWLCAIARRVCSEGRRSRFRRRGREERAMSEAAERRGTSAEAAAESAQRREDLRLLSDAIDGLEPRERLAVHLYYLQADPVESAHELLGVSRSGFYKLLTRARERIRSRMASALAAPSPAEISRSCET
jgi:RNA polymerase sigma-70 factor (ECF subfamily)